MVINTDDVITDRVHMQDVADSMTLSSAAWTARGLNMISFINVLNSKLISTAVLLNALKDTVPGVIAVGNIQLPLATACCGVPIIGTACCFYASLVTFQLSTLGPVKGALETIANSLSKCPSGLLWKVMNATNIAARAVKESFTTIGIVEGVAMAKANGATFGLVLNGKMLGAPDRDSLSLPVTDVDFDAFCPFVKNGGSGFKMAGYKCGTGPFKLGKDRVMKTVLLPYTNLFAHPIFYGMATAHFSQIGCTGDPSDKDQKISVKLKDLAECKTEESVAKWSHMYSRTAPIEEGGYDVDDFTDWRPLKDTGATQPDDVPDISSIGNIDDIAGRVSSVKPFNPGVAYQFLQENLEQSVGGLREAACGFSEYPFYQNLFIFDDDQRGSLHYSCGIKLACKRIDQWTEFTWFSSDHVKNGPKSLGGYFIRVGKKRIAPKSEDEANQNEVPLFVYIVETVTLADAGEKELSQEEFQDYLKENGEEGANDPSQSSSNCTKPRPYVLDDGDQEDFQKKLRFIGVAYRDIQQDQPFWSGFFNTPPKVLTAYAQAQVYNHLEEDTFTQDWRVRLEQASLLTDVIKELPGGGLSDEAAKFVSVINNH